SITYYIDGVRFGQMTTGDRWGFDQRHAIPPVVRMFGDGEADNEVNTYYVNSIQFRDGTITGQQAAALGAATADGIPLVIPGSSAPEQPKLIVTLESNTVKISWDSTVSGFILENADKLPSSNWLAVPGVVNNSVSVTIAPGNKFYRLKK